MVSIKPAESYFNDIMFSKCATGNKSYQFVGDPPHFRHFVRAKVKCDLSEVVIDIVVAVQLNDQDELSEHIIP